nr:uncharacterized protein LOC106679022 [Halyomorpha halys]
MAARYLCCRQILHHYNWNGLCQNTERNLKMFRATKTKEGKSCYHHIKTGTRNGTNGIGTVLCSLAPVSKCPEKDHTCCYSCSHKLEPDKSVVTHKFCAYKWILYILLLAICIGFVEFYLIE